MSGMKIFFGTIPFMLGGALACIYRPHKKPSTITVAWRAKSEEIAKKQNANPFV